MVLGFISLLLTFGQTYILDICIPSHVARTMLPCPAPNMKKEDDDNGESHRRLLSFEHRFLSGGEASPTKCTKEVRVLFFHSVTYLSCWSEDCEKWYNARDVNDGLGLCRAYLCRGTPSVAHPYILLSHFPRSLQLLNYDAWKVEGTLPFQIYSSTSRFRFRKVWLY